MWFLNRLEPDSTEYLVPLVLRLRGTLDAAALGRAFETIAARHEILRTRYAFENGGPVQVVDAPGARALPLPVVPLTEEPAAERERKATEVLREQLATGFDLATEWPVRGTLLRLADDDHILAFVFHHIACDAWSTRVFGGELSALYAAFVSGHEAQLPPLTLQYADYAAWQRQQLAGPGAEAHLDYWRERLAGVEATDLPTDRPRPAVRDHAGADLDFELPDGLADRVREAALKHDTTPFTVLLTAYQTLIARYTGKRDVTVGTVVSGRGRPELQQLIGYGINTLVLRAGWDDQATFGGLVASGRRHILDAFDHQQVPFAQLVDELQPERDQSRTPSTRSPSPCTSGAWTPSSCPASRWNRSVTATASPSATSPSRCRNCPTARSGPASSTPPPSSTRARSAASPVTSCACSTRSWGPGRPPRGHRHPQRGRARHRHRRSGRPPHHRAGHVPRS